MTFRTTLRTAFSFCLSKTGFSNAARVAALLCLATASIGPAAADPAPRPIGGKTAGTPATDIAWAATASRTEIYVTGYTGGALDGPSAGGEDVFVRKYHEEGNLIWARQFGTPGNEQGRGIAVDASGNVYVGGYTNGSIGGSRGGLDAWVRKYNKNGAALWTRQFGTRSLDLINSVAVESGGNIYVAGYTGGSLQGVNKGNTDVFVRKYNPAGAVLWTRQFGSSLSEIATGVATDSQGNVFIAGVTSGALAGPNLGADDLFLIKLNKNGGLIWQKQFGTSGTDDMEVNGLAVDTTGAAIVAGFTNGAFPGFVNAGNLDVFMRKYGPGGSVQKTNQFGTTSADVAFGVATDSANNVFVTGYTVGSLGGPSAGLNDVFVRKYNSGGNVVWTRQFGTSSADQGFGIAAPTSTKIYVVGSTAGALAASYQGSSDAFVRRLGANGGVVWTDQ